MPCFLIDAPQMSDVPSATDGGERARPAAQHGGFMYSCAGIRCVPEPQSPSPHVLVLSTRRNSVRGPGGFSYRGPALTACARRATRGAVYHPAHHLGLYAYMRMATPSVAEVSALALSVTCLSAAL